MNNANDIGVSQAPPLAREIKLFLALCAVENKLDRIIINTPKFTISPALNDNINSYALAVLLSVKLSSYKGNIPRDHVMVSGVPFFTMPLTMIVRLS